MTPRMISIDRLPWNASDPKWKRHCKKISYREFWDSMNFAPIKRMGFSDGPGAMFHSEPYETRICSVTGKAAETRWAHFVVKNAKGEPEYYEGVDNITLEEFKAMCEIVIPGVGPCSGGYGKDL
jgi:hypothetical protein